MIKEGVWVVSFDPVKVGLGAFICKSISDCKDIADSTKSLLRQKSFNHSCYDLAV